MCDLFPQCCLRLRWVGLRRQSRLMVIDSISHLCGLALLEHVPSFDRVERCEESKIYIEWKVTDPTLFSQLGINITNSDTSLPVVDNNRQLSLLVVTPSVLNYKTFWHFYVHCFYYVSRHSVYLSAQQKLESIPSIRICP